MKNSKSKIFVSYNGGTAGDLFTTSCNGVQIDLTDATFVKNKNATLKPYESRITNGEIDLDLVVNDIKEKFISTHLFEFLLDVGYDNFINVVVKDQLIQETLVQRQMSLQNLNIKIDPDSTWFRLIQTWCLSGKFDQAAQYWFEQSKKIWYRSMEARIKNQHGKQLSFDKLLSTQWTDSLQSQGWEHNIDILRKNHKIWLEKNMYFSKEVAISSMQDKLKKMNWNQSSGIIQFAP